MSFSLSSIVGGSNILGTALSAAFPQLELLKAANNLLGGAIGEGIKDAIDQLAKEFGFPPESVAMLKTAVDAVLEQNKQPSDKQATDFVADKAGPQFAAFRDNVRDYTVNSVRQQMSAQGASVQDPRPAQENVVRDLRSAEGTIVRDHRSVAGKVSMQDFHFVQRQNRAAESTLVRDHRTGSSDAVVRDHRAGSGDAVVRDHRAGSGDAVVRDHRSTRGGVTVRDFQDTSWERYRSDARQKVAPTSTPTAGKSWFVALMVALGDVQNLQAFKIEKLAKEVSDVLGLTGEGSEQAQFNKLEEFKAEARLQEVFANVVKTIGDALGNALATVARPS